MRFVFLFYLLLPDGLPGVLRHVTRNFGILAESYLEILVRLLVIESSGLLLCCRRGVPVKISQRLNSGLPTALADSSTYRLDSIAAPHHS